MYSGRDDDQELLAPSEEATSMQRPGLKVISPGGGEVGRRRQVRDFIMIIDSDFLCLMHYSRGAQALIAGKAFGTSMSVQGKSLLIS